jgi:hypothetical protein
MRYLYNQYKTATSLGSVLPHGIFLRTNGGLAMAVPGELDKNEGEEQRLSVSTTERLRCDLKKGNDLFIYLSVYLSLFCW